MKQNKIDIINHKMKWINLLIESQSDYYIYKLDQSDSIIIFDKHQNNNQLLIILYGTLYIIKIFKNGKIIPIMILNENSIFNINKHNKQFYYKLIALEKSYILHTEINNTKIYPKINIKLINSIITSYNKTIKVYEYISEAINQKQTTKKIIQIILFLLMNFGAIKNKQIYLPFKLSQKNLACISRTSEGKISKIIKNINNKSYIKYATNKLINTQHLFNLIV